MKLGILTTAMLLSATMGVGAQPTASPTAPPANTAQPTASPTASPAAAAQPAASPHSYLNTQLQRAYCAQDWRGAIRVVDRMMGVVTTQTNASIYMPALATYRRRLEGLANSTSIVPVEALSGCLAAGAGTTSATNTPTSTNNQVVPR